MPRNLRSDYEEGCGCIVEFKNLHYLVRVLGRSIVNCERDDFCGRGDAPEDIGPLVLEVADQQPRRSVYEPERRDQDAAHATQQNKHRHHPYRALVSSTSSSFIAYVIWKKGSVRAKRHTT